MDERFYTPRAQASTARSTGSFGTPRSYRSSVASSSSDGEYATPRNTLHSNLGGSALPYRSSDRYLIPPYHYTHPISQEEGITDYGPIDNTQHRTKHFSFDVEEGDEENLAYPRNQPIIQPNQQDVESIFSFTRHGRIQEVDNLLKKGVSVDVRDDNGNSILAIACQNGNKRLAKLALRRGADINASNFLGNTPLHFCYKYKKVELGQYLISKGADSTKRNYHGQTCEDLL